MPTVNKTPLIALAALFAAHAIAIAEPKIRDIEGTAEAGSTLKIKGDGFGDKDNARPILFADFEKGLEPTDQGEKKKWDGIQNMEWSKEGPMGAGAAKGSNGKGAWTLGVDRKYWTKEGERSYIFRRQRLNFVITDQSQNWKIWRMWPEGENYPNIYMSSSNGRVYVENVGEESGFWGNLNVQSMDWLNEEIFFQASSMNIKDGVAWFRCNGMDMARGSVMTRSIKAPAYMSRNYPVHAVVANPDRWSPPWNPGNRVWVDEVYVDDSWSRVMISDKPLRKEGRKWEIFVPTAWNRGEIEVTVNAGIFRPGDVAYVFVFDSENQSNEIGYPILITGKSDRLASVN